MTNEATAGVFLADRRVGTLGYADGNTWFDYADRALEHPVLGQAFEIAPDRRRTGSGGLPEWFANLLPERGSGLRSIIGRELGRTNPHDFQVISYLGEDLPGAVRVVPDSGGISVPEPALGKSATEYGAIRFSLAGVQAKFSMRWEGKGLVLPVSGQGGDWIAKLPDRRFPNVPENEYAMLTWAGLAGIDVPEIRLLAGRELTGLPPELVSAAEPVFAIRRFDRTQAGRIHQEDLAQVREVSVDAKYENASYRGIARFIKAVCPGDMDEYLRRTAAMVVIGNLDAHLKNWTLRYPDGRIPRLSPAYDFVCVSAYREFRAEELAFAINGGRIARLITIDNFRQLARGAGLDPDHVAQIVKETAAALADTWPQVKQSCPVPDLVSDHIEHRLTTLPLIAG